MASFKALNVESDDEIDEEPDNTKELQIEEALKNYQTALKFQSQGKAALKETEEAYKVLFESEIFKYPESLSDYNRVQQFGESIQDFGPLDPDSTGEYPGSGPLANAPSTLPQVLHVAYKNRGQYYLDAYRAVQKIPSGAGEDGLNFKILASRALADFAEALDKDGDDVDVWRRAARVSQLLGSQRVSRFCLEAIVDGDDQGTDDVIGDAGIDIKLADQDLRQIKRDVGDIISISPAVPRSHDLPAFWREKLVLYKGFPTLTPSKTPAPQTVTIRCSTWASLAMSLLHRVQAEQQSDCQEVPLSRIKIQFSSHPSQSEAVSSPALNELLSGTRRSSDESSGDSSDVTRLPSIATIHGNVAVDGLVHADVRDAIQSPATVSIPTRKRTPEAAELETPEDGRVRSKRLRARQSLAIVDTRDADGKLVDNSEYEQKIKETTQSDDWLFEWLSPTMKKLGVELTGSSDPYRQLVRKQSTFSADGVRLGQAVNDFYELMRSWDASKMQSLTRPAGASDVDSGEEHFRLLRDLDQTSAASPNRLTEDTFAAGLEAFAAEINRRQFWTTSEVGVSLLFRLLSYNADNTLCNTAYVRETWSKDLKAAVFELAALLNESLEDHVAHTFQRNGSRQSSLSQVRDVQTALELAQTMFEITLDAHELLYKGPLQPTAARNAEIWSELSRELIGLAFQDLPCLREAETFMLTRHLWASVFQMQLTGDASREHTVTCLNDLRQELASTGYNFLLPNNTVIPQLSGDAAERQISRLETMDFFFNIFQKKNRSPIDLIESLEALLETTIRAMPPLDLEAGHDEEPESAVPSARRDDSSDARLRSQVLARFFEKASPSLRLLLWTRLREAYETINYPSKVLSIHLRCVGVILTRLTTETYLSASTTERNTVILDTVRDLRETLDSIWQLFANNKEDTLLECLDLDHLRSSLQVACDLWIFLYSVSLFDDYSQLGGKGGSSTNPFRIYPTDTFHNAAIMLHNMQIQTSILIYRLLSDAMKQAPAIFPQPADTKLQYLRFVHYHYGIRRTCKALDSAFLHFMKDELMLYLPEVEEQSSNDLAQVLYDLYQMHCFSGALEKQEHGCDADHLKIDTAKELVNFVIDKARRLTSAQLLKSELGKTVDKLHTTLAWAVKSKSIDARRNAHIYQALFQAPIHPVELYQCVKGIAHIAAVTINGEEAAIAAKGWFFLKGQLSLAKYKTERTKGRTGMEDELEQAQTFFLQDLEYNPDRWETWLRLAQAQSYLLDELVMWKATDLNENFEDVVKQQKAALHSFIMATAVAVSNAEASEEASIKLGELYQDFAVLLYSATREPFSMAVFQLEDYPAKYYFPSQDLHTGRVFHALSPLEGWKFSAVLLRIAANHQPGNWQNRYWYAKCLWKLHSRYGGGRESSRKPVLAAFKRLMQILPERKDQKEPLLDPIYKMISATHKLVTRGEMSPEDGDIYIRDCLKHQKQMDSSKKPSYITGTTIWDAYMIDLLKVLRQADKVRWHHRFVVRAAALIRAQCKDAFEGATAAKEYLVAEHIYSVKTLNTQIWKPEPERSGRRFVYMTHYALFIAELLNDTNDLEGIQILTRRVRKKVSDFADHVELWSTIVYTHLEMHRRQGKIGTAAHDPIFRLMDGDEFASKATKIDQWICHPKDDFPLYEILHEVAELKKLNSNLVNATEIDTLLADTYSEIWAHLQDKIEFDTIPTTAQQVHSRATSAGLENKAELNERRNMMSLTQVMNGDSLESRLSPAPGYQGPSDMNGQMPLPRPKSRIISYRTIIKRAGEAGLARPVPKVATPPRRISSVDTSHIQVVINKPASSDATSHPNSANGDDAAATARSNVSGSARGSVAPSLHDSADDESEISEIGSSQFSENEVDDFVKPAFSGIGGSNKFTSASRVVAREEDDVQRSKADRDDEDTQERVDGNGNEGIEVEGGRKAEGERQIDAIKMD